MQASLISLDFCSPSSLSCCTRCDNAYLTPEEAKDFVAYGAPRTIRHLSMGRRSDGSSSLPVQQQLDYSYSTMLVLLLSLGGVAATSVPLINQKTFGHVSNHRVRLSCAEPHGLCCFPKPFYNFYFVSRHSAQHPTHSNLQSVKNGPLPAHTEVTTFEHNCTTAPCTVTQIHVPSIYPGQGDVCSNCNNNQTCKHTVRARARTHTHTFEVKWVCVVCVTFDD